MAYNERLAERIRTILRGRRRVTEKKMFGGLAFMVNGHMCVGINGDDLMVRVGPERYERSLEYKHARPMDFTGKPLKGMVYVSPPGYRSTVNLTRWVEDGLKFVRSIPPKP